jgi:uncharacterized protein
MEKKKWLHMIAFVLVVIGGLNWGIYGLFGVDIVEALFGGIIVNNTPIVSSIIYSLVGIATVYLVSTHKSDCKICGTGSSK